MCIIITFCRFLAHGHVQLAPIYVSKFGNFRVDSDGIFFSDLYILACVYYEVL